MKPVTQERLLKAHRHRMDWAFGHKACKIQHIFFRHGLKAVCNQAFGQINQSETERTKLDLNYQEAFDSEDVMRRLNDAGIEFINVMDRIDELGLAYSEESICCAAWSLLADRVRERGYAIADKLRKIQHQHKISGLKKEEYELGYEKVAFLAPSFWGGLELMDSDHWILAQQRFDMADAFLRAVHVNGMRLFKTCEKGWEAAKPDDVLAAISRSSFSQMHTDCYFVDPVELETKGFASTKRQPTAPGDRMEWEITLSCGTGDYSARLSDRIDEQEWYFCGYIGSSQCPSL